MLLYFPDHGLDLYDSHADYFGHSKGTPFSEKVSKKIPMVIYLSNNIRSEHPELQNMLRQSVNDTISLGPIVFTLLHLSGFDTDDRLVKDWSAFKSTKKARGKDK